MNEWFYPIGLHFSKCTQNIAYIQKDISPVEVSSPSFSQPLTLAMPDGSQLGQQIADLVVETYNSIQNKAAKPIVRLNGVREWTILAGLVAIEDGSLTPLTLATGMKAMPNEVREYSSGLIVHDLHAEILCLRMFNRLLMAEVNRLEEEELRRKTGKRLDSDGECKFSQLKKQNLGKISDASGSTEESLGNRRSLGGASINSYGNGKSEDAEIKDEEVSESKSQIETLLLKRNGEKFALRSGVKLALYISEPPCGDASMSHISNDEKSWEHSNTEEVVRGRAHFNTVGIVRTKPGRADSKVSYSKSCSDKLCVKQYTGILNSISSHFVEPIYLDYLVIPALKFLEIDFRRCFQSRATGPKPPSAHFISALPFKDDKFPYKKESDATSPLPLSYVFCAKTKESQVLQNGVKNGAYVKNKPPRKNGASCICRQSLCQQVGAKLQQYQNYEEVKTANIARQQLKTLVRSLLGSWPESAPENFVLEHSTWLWANPMFVYIQPYVQTCYSESEALPSSSPSSSSSLPTAADTPAASAPAYSALFNNSKSLALFTT